ncbi:flagellar basal-body MS-ring/collar protein FliF [Comamonas guangdongensis]|uniref:Flagellar M-ring protein n=1 Tax=Comamonas guangdongensis TaxID=510515 RepID=A0ABV3ZSC4_9BURK
MKNRLSSLPGKGGVLSFASHPGLARVALPLVLVAAIVTAVVVLLMWQGSGHYRPLFGARENVATADVVSVLEADGLKYRLDPDSGQVLVADTDLGRARMLLAAKGVAAKLPEGLELMDRNDPLGVSQFVQDVRFRRGLEGELARSIGSLDAVAAARVHLSIARSSSFVVNTGDKSSASVVLQLKPGQQLKQEQIAAIIHMVASSVAGLEPQRVALTDQAGNFLSARVDLSEGFDPLAQEGQAGKLSAELRQNAQELLTAAVGEGHFRVTVTADLSQDRTEESFERYSGDPRVLSEATREENDRHGGVALGVPGSLSNRPVNVQAEPGKDAAKDAANGNFRAAVSRSYAYDRNVVQVKRGKGRINKLHVAVMLDDAVAPQQAKAWTAEELARVEKLLRVGLGVDAARGDQIAVASMAFKAPLALPAWWEQPSHWFDIAVMVLWSLAGVVVLVVLVRLVNGVLRHLREGGRTAATTAAEPALLGAAAGAAGLLQAPQAAARPSAELSMVPLLEDVDLPPPGSEVDVMVEHLRTLAAKEPERVAEVVKQWVQKHGQPVGNGR